MPAKTRPYLFYDTAVSICTTCYRRIDAKIVFEDDNVYMLKRCPQHGFERVLISDDIDYYRRCREVFIKPPEMPDRYNTPIKYGCPYDCGLCPDHEQHSCLSLLEINDACNLTCPICYAAIRHPPHRRTSPSTRSNACSTAIVTNEAEPDVVQISGGEPTIHPRLLRHPRRRQAPPHQAPHGQHQRHPHRAGRSLRRTASPPTCRSSSSTSSSTPSAANPSCNSAAPTSAASAKRPSNASTNSTSPPRSSSP